MRKHVVVGVFFAYVKTKALLLLPKIRNFKPLTIFCDRTARLVSDLVGKPKYMFSHDAAEIVH